MTQKDSHWLCDPRADLRALKDEVPRYKSGAFCFEVALGARENAEGCLQMRGGSDIIGVLVRGLAQMNEKEVS